MYEHLIGTQFEYKGKAYTFKGIEKDCVVGKDSPDSPLRLLLPMIKYNELTGHNLIPPPPVVFTPEMREEHEATRAAEAIRYTNGKNGKQMMDEYIASGYTVLENVRYKGRGNWRLENPNTHFSIPLRKGERRYAQIVLNKLQGKD